MPGAVRRLTSTWDFWRRSLGSDFNLSKTGFEGSRDISLPVTYRLGTSYKYDRYLGVTDFVVVDNKLRLHAGLEASLQKMFRLRAGYMFNYDSKNITAGA